MKAILLFLIAALVAIMIPAPMMADSGCDNGSCKEEITINMETSTNAFASGENGGYDHIGVGKIDPSWGPTFSPPVHFEKGDIKRVAEIYAETGMFPLSGTRLNEGVKVLDLATLRTGHWRAGPPSYTNDPVIASATSDDDTIIVLDHFPAGAKQIAWAKAHPKDEKETFYSPAADGILRIRKVKPGVKYFVVLFNPRLVTQSKTRGAAISALQSVIEAIATKGVFAASGGVGGANVEGYGYKDALLEIIALDGPGLLPDQSVAEMSPTSYQEVLNFEDIFYDLDSDEIRNDQENTFIRNALKIDQMLQSLGPNERIRTIGRTCFLGTEKHNRDLSVRRGEKYRNYTYDILIENRGYDPDFLNQKLLPGGEGENYPKYAKLADNRNVSVVVETF